MNAYVCYAGDPVDGSVLVFAGTAREARRLGGRDVIGWTQCRYIDVRAKKIPLTPVIVSYALHEHSHVVESPPSCESCLQWGLEIVDGLCDSCRDGAP